MAVIGDRRIAVVILGMFGFFFSLMLIGEVGKMLPAAPATPVPDILSSPELRSLAEVQLSRIGESNHVRTDMMTVGEWYRQCDCGRSSDVPETATIYVYEADGAFKSQTGEPKQTVVIVLNAQTGELLSTFYDHSILK